MSKELDNRFVNHRAINAVSERITKRFKSGDHHGDITPEAFYVDGTLSKKLLTMAGDLRSGLDGQPGATPPSFCFGCVVKHSGTDGGAELQGMLNHLNPDDLRLQALGKAVADD